MRRCFVAFIGGFFSGSLTGGRSTRGSFIGGPFLGGSLTGGCLIGGCLTGGFEGPFFPARASLMRYATQSSCLKRNTDEPLVCPSELPIAVGPRDARCEEHDEFAGAASRAQMRQDRRAIAEREGFESSERHLG